MSSPLTHVVAGVAIAHSLGGDHYAAAVAYSVLPDIDHVFVWTRDLLVSHSLDLGLWDDDGLLYARTMLHEIPGMILFSMAGLLIALLFSTTHGKLLVLGTTTHLFLDFVTGASKPLRPFSNRMMDFRLPRKFRIIEEMVIFILFVLVWLF